MKIKFRRFMRRFWKWFLVDRWVVCGRDRREDVMSKVLLSKRMRRMLWDRDARQQLRSALNKGGGKVVFEGKTYKVTIIGQG
jgi:hypothetical protein